MQFKNKIPILPSCIWKSPKLLLQRQIYFYLSSYYYFFHGKNIFPVPRPIHSCRNHIQHWIFADKLPTEAVSPILLPSTATPKAPEWQRDHLQALAHNNPDHLPPLYTGKIITSSSLLHYWTVVNHSFKRGELFYCRGITQRAYRELKWILHDVLEVRRIVFFKYIFV